VLVVLAFALRTYRLGEENFWIDEVMHVESASRPIGQIVRGAKPGADGGPLASIVSSLLRPAEANESTMRIPAAISGTGTVLVTAVLASRLLPSPVPFVTGLLMAISPLHVWYSQEARWYGPWVLLVTLSYLVLWRGLHDREPGIWGLYMVLAVLSIYTFVLSPLFVMAHIVTIWWARRAAGLPVRFLPASRLLRLAVLAASIPLVIVVVSNLHATTGTPRPAMLAVLPYTAYAFGVGFSLGPSLAYLHHLPSLTRILADHPEVGVVAVIFGVPLVAGLLRVWRDPVAGPVLLPWLFLPPVLVFALGLGTNVTYEVRYALASLPAYVMVLATGIETLTPRLVSALALATVLGSMGLSLANHYWNPRYDREDVRAAVQAIERGGADVPVVVVGQIDAAVRWYGRDLGLEVMHQCDPEPNGYDPLEREALHDAAAIWILSGRDWTGEAQRCLARLGPTYALAAHERFNGVELWRLEHRTP
jgi:4-amino-4-deoxy-L-arabinose transferase-like glycosyltransferase